MRDIQTTQLPTKLIERAMEVFARGFSFTRSMTHPYLAERVGPVWVVRDGPRRNGEYRREEWAAHAVEPADVDRIARQHTRGRFAVCALAAAGQSDAPLRSGYKALGYRLGRTEAVMVHHLARVPRAVPATASPTTKPAVIRRVMTQAMADDLAQAAGRRQILPEHLCKDAPIRQYAALIGDAIVGWVASITVDDATWCSNLHVQAEHRRRGIGRALMARMLRDDRAAGSTLSVLTASHTGAMLYPTIGYAQVATLLLFTPGKIRSQQEPKQA